MRKSLLICIAFHCSEKRVDYLKRILAEIFFTYDIDCKIIIDTNSHDAYNLIKTLNPIKVDIVVHENLAHPFHLTWMHRKHIKHNIDNYDYFMYLEDDMLLPYENFLNYIENFKLLWPVAVPGFIRIEKHDGVEYVADVTEHHKLKNVNCVGCGDKKFESLPFLQNYHAFWIMPQKELKETMKPDFVKVTDGREFAAMYVGWELGKPCLVQIENGQVSTKCYSYHLPNNVSKKIIKANEIFI